MDTDTHPDPFEDALHHGIQRAVQIGSGALTAARLYAYHKNAHAQAATERDDRARRALNEQIRSDRDAARVLWTPALDPGWLRDADVLQTARAWSAAVPHADRAAPWYEPAAAAAMRRTEERLRVLHPYAMARYDRLRSDGLTPAAAMREAAPLFTRPGRVREGFYTPSPVIEAADIAPRSWLDISDLGSQSRELATAQAQQQHGEDVIDALQARAHAQGRPPLGEAAQRTVLETVTNLPAEIIDRAVQSGDTTALTGAEKTRAAEAGLPASTGIDEHTENLTDVHNATAPADAARAPRTPQPWERDFPAPIHDVVAAATAPAVATPSPEPSPPLRAPKRGARP